MDEASVAASSTYPARVVTNESTPTPNGPATVVTNESTPTDGTPNDFLSPEGSDLTLA